MEAMQEIELIYSDDEEHSDDSTHFHRTRTHAQVHRKYYDHGKMTQTQELRIKANPHLAGQMQKIKDRERNRELKRQTTRESQQTPVEKKYRVGGREYSLGDRVLIITGGNAGKMGVVAREYNAKKKKWGINVFMNKQETVKKAFWLEADQLQLEDPDPTDGYDTYSGTAVDSSQAATRTATPPRSRDMTHQMSPKGRKKDDAQIFNIPPDPPAFNINNESDLDNQPASAGSDSESSSKPGTVDGKSPQKTPMPLSPKHKKESKAHRRLKATTKAKTNQSPKSVKSPKGKKRDTASNIATLPTRDRTDDFDPDRPPEHEEF